mmetsp:Transcript_11/g.25  ORF Transcript_11/g.25 Transcript_11/m.25 type:complete len:83 (-) Transcript_11:227-475(-)
MALIWVSKFKNRKKDTPLILLFITVQTPCLDEFVYFHVEEDVGQVVVHERTGATVDLHTGDIVATRYEPVRGLVATGQIALI